jgi:hypothetical protein
MPAPKGRPKPAKSGIKKGQKQRRTLEWEEFGKTVIEGNLDRIQDYMNTLEGRELFEAWLKVVDYFRPKMQRMETPDIKTVEPARITLETVETREELEALEALRKEMNMPEGEYLTGKSTI